MSIITKIFGTKSEREVKKILPLVEKIEALDEKFSKMSEKELRGMTQVLKDRLAKGETLDDILPEAFATVREASFRVLEMKHFKVQLIGGVVIHQGRIAEMKTGEGKTLMATLPAYLNALTGKGVHIVTVNDYLARRDSEWMGKVYNYLGLSVGLIVHGLTQFERKQAYAADITYGTNNEYGFDYLRDNMAIHKENLVQRGHAFAVVDEVDSILIDEARTPLIISGEGDASTDMYSKADRFAAGLRAHIIKELDNKQEQDNIEGDYIVDEKKKTVVLTAEGVKKAEKYFGVDNLSDTDNITLSNHINLAIRARGSMKKDVDYVVKDGEVLIVDTFTGRIMLGRRFSNGLHQAIEAKEGVKIKNESKTLATITFQNFFRLYGKLSGMTGTALTEEEEFQEIYKLDVVEIPTNRPMQRKDENDVVYRTVRGKYNAIVQQIKECNAKGQPVLVGTVSIEKSELLSSILTKNGIDHTVLNAKFHEKEAEIVAQAGKLGAVTISTNMAGRGTDIMLGGNAEYLAKNEMKKMGFGPEQISVATSYFETEDEEIIALRKTYNQLYSRFKQEIAPEAKKVQEAGGLYILGTERHESRRIDNQLRGRAGRQGDPGASRFFLSLEDDLLRLFGSEKIAGMVERLGLDEDTPIDAAILSGTIENAQKRLESINFERRKNVLLYDNVMNQQREGVYKKRASILQGDDVKDLIDKWIGEYVELGCESFLVGDTVEEWNLEGLRGYFYGILTDDNDFKYDEKEIHKVTEDKIINELLERARTKYAEKEELFPDGHLREIERIILLRNIDRHWIDHIDAMDDLEDGIGLRAWGQKDPVKEYQFEADNMFAEMNDAIKEETVKMLLQVMPASNVRHVGITGTVSEARKQIPGGVTAPVPPAATPMAAPVSRENVYGKAAAAQKENKTPYVKPSSEKVGRNDPCPCASGKKYKKCCGANTNEE